MLNPESRILFRLSYYEPVDFITDSASVVLLGSHACSLELGTGTDQV